jgi:hypothetical protein
MVVLVVVVYNGTTNFSHLQLSQYKHGAYWYYKCEEFVAPIILVVVRWW